MSEYMSARHDTARIILINQQIAPIFINTDVDSAIYYLMKAVEISENGIASAESEQIARIFESLKGGTLRLLGNAFLLQGRFDLSLEYFFSSLRIAESQGDLPATASSYHNIGNVFNSQGLHDQALEYYLMAYSIASELGDARIMSYSSNNIGNIYRVKENLDSALAYYHASAVVKEKLNDIGGLIITYNNIGLVHKTRDQFNEALTYYRKSYHLASEQGNKPGMALVLGNMASLYIAMADAAGKDQRPDWRHQYLLTSVDHGLRALELAREIRAVPRQNMVAGFLKDAYRELGNHREALRYADLFIETRDSIFNEEKTRAIAEMQARFESEKRLQEIENQQLIIDKQHADSQRQLAQRNLLIVSTFLMTLLAFVIARMYFQNKKVGAIISEKNQMLEKAYEELQTTNEELQAANEELHQQQETMKKHLENKILVAEQMLQFKQKFLANMSHEIRTPLTGIFGITDALMKTPLNEEQKRYLDILQSSGDSLREIINDVLDYSKIEAGKLELKMSVFNPAIVMQSAMGLYSKSTRPGVEMKMHVDRNLPGFIEADALRVGQVIRNLLSNAVKFTEKGVIELTAHLEKEPDDNRYAVLKFVVSDTGKGISASRMRKLFKPFTQLHEDELDTIEGTGLGLSISKEIVTMHQGEIGVNSIVGEGSQFWFTIKARIVRVLTDPGKNTAEKASGDKKKLHILLVEDKELNRKVLSLMLKGLGHDVGIAVNGKDALDKYEPRKYDLILMDIQMPVMDGVTAAGKLREMYSDLPPIVGLSANAFKGDREKFMKLGLDEYLTKPLEEEDFQELVQKLF